jgi:hypothetical protein
MLEFIVLGQIPGTHFQITFAWLLASVLVLILAKEFWRLLEHFFKHPVPTQPAASTSPALPVTVPQTPPKPEFDDYLALQSLLILSQYAKRLSNRA